MMNQYRCDAEVAMGLSREIFEQKIAELKDGQLQDRLLQDRLRREAEAYREGEALVLAIYESNFDTACFGLGGSETRALHWWSAIENLLGNRVKAVRLQRVANQMQERREAVQRGRNNYN